MKVDVIIDCSNLNSLFSYRASIILIELSCRSESRYSTIITVIVLDYDNGYYYVGEYD
jgi:hypothetical protein